MSDDKAELLRENHALYQRRANNPNWGCQADRIRMACQANNAADQYFSLTGKNIEEYV